MVKKILLLFLGVIFLGELYAQNAKIYLKDCNNLDSLSKVFFTLGDNKFLVIDAYRDGLIKDNSYQFAYREGVLRLNGKFIHKPFSSQYLAKLRTIENNLDEKPGSVIFTIGPGDLVEENVFIYLPPFDRYRHREKILNAYFQKPPIINTKDSLLVIAMIKDKIIFPGEFVHIKYNKFGVWINDIQLSNVKSRKYIPVLERLTNIPAPDKKTDFAGTDLSSFETKTYAILNE